MTTPLQQAQAEAAAVVAYLKTLTPTVTYPSGKTPPPVAAGFTRALFDDFIAPTIDNTKWATPPYEGTSYSSRNGEYLSSHVVLTPSICNFEVYEDVLSGGVANGYAGGGMQTAAIYPNGTIFRFAARDDVLAGATAIGLVGPKGKWPCEADITEGGMINFHWGAGNTTKAFPQPVSLLDAQWHLFEFVYGLDFLKVSVDGVMQVNFANPDPSPTDINGFGVPVMLSLQKQTGDPNNPVVDPAINAANPSRFQVDWVAIDVPA